MKVAITCIAKDEEHYIEEWVKYHLKLGFDDVFIYENDWRCSLNDSRVHKINFDGYGMQINAYNHFIQTYYTQYDWVAFFDVDEFLVLKKHKNVKDFIQDYGANSCIGINWAMFGNNGLSFDGNYSVLNRFTKRKESSWNNIKCIIKMDPSIRYGVHDPFNASVADTNGKIFRGAINENGPIDVAQLNHYFCKTWEEWILKKEKGSGHLTPDHPSFYRPDSDFHRHNTNEVEDTLALEFYLS